MKVRIRDIYNSTLLVEIMLLILVVPTSFIRFNIITTIYRFLGISCMLLLLLLVVYFTKWTKSMIWIFLFYGVVLFTTVINNGDIKSFFYENFPSFTVCLLFALWLKKAPNVLFKASRVLDIYIYINFVTMLLFPNGLYVVTNEPHWFLGHKNVIVRTLLPIICMALIRAYSKYGKIKISTIILLVCSSITMILAGSSTALVGYIIFIGLLFLYHKKNKKLPRIFSLLNGLIATAVAFLVIVVLNLQVYFSYFIVEILGRDLTLTNRTTVWAMTIVKLSNKWLTGYGYITGGQYSMTYNRVAYTHPHNYFLYVAMSGGIILIFVLLAGFLIANKSINSSIHTVYSKIILFVLIAFLVMGLTESLVSTSLLYPILLLGMNAGLFADFTYGPHKKNNNIYT